MIKGLTHDKDNVLNKVQKYKGKISTGFAPNEGPNKNNYPKAAGYFRILKEVVQTTRTSGGKENVIKKWKLNEAIQKKLEESLGTKTPRKIEFMCLFKDPRQLWESYLAMYSSTDGLLCRSYGEGLEADWLQFDTKGERDWKKRTCEYKNCPDYKNKSCKEMGVMKVFPILDLSSQPYRFETRSINTIVGIESSLDDMWNLLKAAYVVQCREAKKDLRFQGLFGAKLTLAHRKSKSGGRDIYITDLVPTQEFSDSLMAPIGRGVTMNQTAALTAGNSDGVRMLGIDIDSVENDIVTPSETMDEKDGAEVANTFNSKPESGTAVKSEESVLGDAAVSMMEEKEKEKEKE